MRLLPALAVLTIAILTWPSVPDDEGRLQAEDSGAVAKTAAWHWQPPEAWPGQTLIAATPPLDWRATKPASAPSCPTPLHTAEESNVAAEGPDATPFCRSCQTQTPGRPDPGSQTVTQQDTDLAASQGPSQPTPAKHCSDRRPQPTVVSALPAGALSPVGGTGGPCAVGVSQRPQPVTRLRLRVFRRRLRR